MNHLSKSCCSIAGGNIAKQSFVAALGDLMPDIRTKDRTGVWELLDLVMLHNELSLSVLLACYCC